MFIQDWQDVFLVSYQQVWGTVLGFLPNLVVALIVFVIGWMIAVALAKLVEKVVDALKIDPLLAKMGMEKPLERAGMVLDAGHFVGELVKWFVLLVVFLTSADILGLQGVSEFLNTVLIPYIPKVIVAAVILLLGILFANLTQRIVQASVSATGVGFSRMIGAVSWWAVVIFAFITALEQLQVNLFFLQTLYTGIIAMLTIAFGLAFGMAGKEAAADFLGKLKEQTRDRNF